MPTSREELLNRPLPDIDIPKVDANEANTIPIAWQRRLPPCSTRRRDPSPPVELVPEWSIRRGEPGVEEVGHARPVWARSSTAVETHRGETVDSSTEIGLKIGYMRQTTTHRFERSSSNSTSTDSTVVRARQPTRRSRCRCPWPSLCALCRFLVLAVILLLLTVLYCIMGFRSRPAKQTPKITTDSPRSEPGNFLPIPPSIPCLNAVTPSSSLSVIDLSLSELNKQLGDLSIIHSGAQTALSQYRSSALPAHLVAISRKVDTIPSPSTLVAITNQLSSIINSLSDVHHNLHLLNSSISTILSSTHAHLPAKPSTFASKLAAFFSTLNGNFFGRNISSLNLVLLHRDFKAGHAEVETALRAARRTLIEMQAQVSLACASASVYDNRKLGYFSLGLVHRGECPARFESRPPALPDRREGEGHTEGEMINLVKATVGMTELACRDLEAAIGDVDDGVGSLGRVQVKSLWWQTNELRSKLDEVTERIEQVKHQGLLGKL